MVVLLSSGSAVGVLTLSASNEDKSSVSSDKVSGVDVIGLDGVDNDDKTESKELTVDCDNTGESVLEDDKVSGVDVIGLGGVDNDVKTEYKEATVDCDDTGDSVLDDGLDDTAAIEDLDKSLDKGELEVLCSDVDVTGIVVEFNK